jgi:hypothetical protein
MLAGRVSSSSCTSSVRPRRRPFELSRKRAAFEALHDEETLPIGLSRALLIGIMLESRTRRD